MSPNSRTPAGRSAGVPNIKRAGRPNAHTKRTTKPADVSDIAARRAHRFVMSMTDEELRRVDVRNDLELVIAFAMAAIDEPDEMTSWIATAAHHMRRAEAQILKAAL